MTRDDLEQLDTQSLRALARERFANKARSLRTRGALLAALTRSFAPSAPLPTLPAPRQRKKTQAQATVGPLPTSVRAAKPFSQKAAARPNAEPPRPIPHEGSSQESLVEEGFFVGPLAKRPEPSRSVALRGKGQPATPDAPAARARTLGGDEVPHLLARDATTLFLFWDFRRDLERGAAFGLVEPRVHFRLYDAETWVRTVEAPLGRRSLYLEALEPGHLYSVEAWLAGSDGHERPTGRRSAAVRLAPDAPSPRLDVQHSRVPWDEPLREWRDPGPPAQSPQEGRLAPPARVELPASLDWRGGRGPGGPTSGRP